MPGHRRRMNQTRRPKKVELRVYVTKQPDLEGMKYMSKGDDRHVKAAVKNIQKCMIEEKIKEGRRISTYFGSNSLYFQFEER